MYVVLSPNNFVPSHGGSKAPRAQHGVNGHNTPQTGASQPAHA
jgi:hypothetical protein